jgi:two-component system, sensor histidine kinase LadS
LFLSAFPIQLFSTPLIELNGDNTFNVLQDIEYSESFPKNTNLPSILESQVTHWKKYPKSQVFLYGTPQKHIWLRFELQNNFYAQLYFLRVKEFTIDQIRCYVVYDSGEIKTFHGGTNFPLDEKSIHSIDSIFPIYLKSGEKVTVYLDLHSEIITYTYINLHSTTGILGHTIRENFFLGAYYGFLLFMVILSLAIFIYLKDYSYLFYFFFLILYGLFQFSKNSYTTFFLYPNYPEINGDVWYVLLILSFTSSALFARLFLNLQKFSPLLDKIVFYGSFGILIFIPLPYIISENVIYLVPFVGALYILVIYPASFYVYKKGFTPAKYFIAAWGFLILGILVSIFSFQYAMWGEYASQVGSTLEVLFMALAILSKANKTQKDKENIEEIASGYEKELALASEIQLSLLPKKPPEIKNTNIFSFFLPMNQVGGDFYDFHVKNDHAFSCIMADVSGHGPSAALIASMAKLSFKETASVCDRPEHALRKMNSSLLGNLGKKFVTAMYAHFNTKHKTLTYASAGHPPMLIHRRSEDKFLTLESRGQFLGWFKDIKIKEHSVKLLPGDRVIIYTDGIIEAFNPEMEMFDYHRLEQVLKSNENFSAEEMCYFLIYTIKEWVGFKNHFGDDITFTVIDIL